MHPFHWLISTQVVSAAWYAAQNPFSRVDVPTSTAVFRRMFDVWVRNSYPDYKPGDEHDGRDATIERLVGDAVCSCATRSTCGSAARTLSLGYCSRRCGLTSSRKPACSSSRGRRPVANKYLELYFPANGRVA